jgi:hypothetical protein
VLGAGGLSDVTVEEVAVPLRAGSFDEWFTRTSAIAGPLAARLAALPEAARAALRARLQEATAPYATPAGGLDIPGVSLVASGHV